jgi:hypothetical protein
MDVHGKCQFHYVNEIKNSIAKRLSLYCVEILLAKAMCYVGDVYILYYESCFEPQMCWAFGVMSFQS